MRWATILAVACAAAGLQGVHPQVATAEGGGRGGREDDWWPPVYAVELPGLRPASGGGGKEEGSRRRAAPGAEPPPPAADGPQPPGSPEEPGWWPPVYALELPGLPPVSGRPGEDGRPEPRAPRAAPGPQAPGRSGAAPALPPVPYAAGALAAREPLAALPAPEAAAGAPAAGLARTPAAALAGYADRLARAEERRVAAARAWGLRRTPLVPPPPPPPGGRPRTDAEPGQISGDGLPPVITRVPTDDKVVFLTIDDGSEKDPRLLRMLRELEIPASGFLADYVARDDYDYFRQARREGTRMHNHTVNHLELTRLSYGEQREEICRQQDTLEREIGERPTLFRPPYGAYDRDTLRAAAGCGVRVVPLWAEEAFPDRIEWSRPDGRLHPGDIILTHFRGPDEWGSGGDMTDMLRRVLDTVTAQGFAVARLEDYVG
jgi:peptidoglycan/xylan/chitin deacetylase (PgdA/CDA1 family)